MKLLTTILFAIFLSACLEQNPPIPTSNKSAEEIVAEIHNMNTQAYVIYKKEEFDGRFSREFVLNIGETRELSGFKTTQNYFLRAVRLDLPVEEFEFEWSIDKREENIYISF